MTFSILIALLLSLGLMSEENVEGNNYSEEYYEELLENSEIYNTIESDVI